jgi:hypothetical protein
VQVDDAVVQQLAAIGSLRELNLGRCRAVGDKGVCALAAKQPQLQSLSLDDCPAVSDASLLALAASCKGLQVSRNTAPCSLTCQ